MKRTSSILWNRRPLTVNVPLAEKIGLQEAIVVQQLQYWLDQSKKIFDGRPWCYNTIPEWHEQFSWVSEKTVERLLARLRDVGIVLTGNYNPAGYDRKLWYSLDYELLDAIDEGKVVVKKEKDKLVLHIPTTCQDGIRQLDDMETDNLSDSKPTTLPDGNRQHDATNSLDYTEITQRDHHHHQRTAPQAGNIFQIFEQEFGRPLSPIEYERITSWLDTERYTEELVKRALKESVLHAKMSFVYIDRCLLNWHKQGWTTPEHVDAAHRAAHEINQGRSQTTAGRESGGSAKHQGIGGGVQTGDGSITGGKTGWIRPD